MGIVENCGWLLLPQDNGLYTIAKRLPNGELKKFVIDSNEDLARSLLVTLPHSPFLHLHD